MIVQPQPCRISPNDILSGKGRSKDFHQGNIAFRNIVMKYKVSYSKGASNEEKCHYAVMVISEVKAQDPPGRFLRCNSDDKWCELDDASVIKKVRQALREDAPSIRRRTSNNKKNLASGDDFIMEPSPPKQGKRSCKRRKTSQDSDCRKDDLHKCPHDLLIDATVVKKTEQESAEELKTDEDLQTTPKKIVVCNRVSTSTRRARWSQFAASLEDRDIDRQCQQAVPPKRSLSRLVSSFQDDYDNVPEKGEEVVLQPFSNKNDMHEEEGIFFDDHEDISPLPVTTIVEEDEDYLELMDEIIMLGH